MSSASSRDELYDQLSLQQVILASLDPDDEGYESAKAQAEASIEELSARLQSRPQTPTSQNDDFEPPHSGESFSLPSRDAQHLRPGSNASPLQRAGTRPQWPPEWTSNSKRQRDSFHVPNGESFKRSRKNSESPSNSSLSTPASHDSFDRTEQEVGPSQSRLPPKPNLLERLLREQRIREAQYLREKKDSEHARNLSQGFDSHAGGSSAPGSSRNTQSYLGFDGRISKPAAPAPLNGIQPPQKPPQYSHLPAWMTSTNRMPTVPSQSRPLHEGRPHATPKPTANAQRQLGSSQAPILLDEDDDDVSVAARRRRIPLPGAYPQPFPPSTFTNAARNHAYPPLLGLPPSRAPCPGAISSLSSTYPTLGGTGVYGAASNLVSSGLQALGNVVKWGGIDLQSNPIDLDGSFAAPRRLPTLEENLHARGLDYMLNDSARSREELEALIENIRPDEEIPPEMRIGSPPELRIPLMEHQKLGLAWLQQQEASNAKGGILADDMGLGKTIQALALIATRRSTNPARKTTLIVAPVALLRQWKRETDERMHPRHKLSAFIYHGQHRNMTFAKLATYDVVLTTFGKLASEYKRWNMFQERKKMDRSARPRPSESLVLLDDGSHFHRIIVDEAQNIKNHNTKSALGALYLKSEFRLCMTGTPMMNSVEELYSLIRFLRIPPYNSQETFNRAFKRPLQSQGSYDQHAKDAAMKALQVLLKSIMLRRTKDSKIDGKPILNLPPRTTEITHAVFEFEQEQLYRALEQQTQLEMNKFLAKGTRLTNYSYVLVRLLRLRQACDHPHLIQDLSGEAYSDVNPEIMEDLAQKLAPEVIQRIKDANGAFECPICYDAVENPSIFFPCGHDCCPDCFVRVTDPTMNPEGGHGAKCPECRQPLDTKKIIDYRCFKKIFMPEAVVDGAKEHVKEEGVQSDDSDDDSDSDSDDADSQGDLRDFIVKDDEVEEASETDNEPTHDPNAPEAEEDDGIEDAFARPAAPPKAPQAELASIFQGKGKGKNKGKGKGKQPKKHKKKVTLAELRAASLRNAAAKKKYFKRLKKDYIPSAKIEKTMKIIRGIDANDPSEKIIIFSQFTTFLDFLEIPINDEGWGYRRYDGAMSATSRNDAVMDFQETSKGVKIMLVSLKAGNAGLNLTAASQVIILDPFWNPFIEEQAVDRAHRIGQLRPVRVHRMLIEKTVEDRIVELQEKKRELINQALDEKAGKSLSRLGRAELRYLFGLDRRLEQ